MSVCAADPRVASLVDKIARRHCGAGVDLNELVGAGMLAACEAAERFDPAKGSLPAFLHRRIHGAIIDAARKDCSPILTPRGCPPKRTVGDSQRDSQGDGQLSLADLVSDHRADLRPDVWAMVDALPEEQAEVIRTRYGFDGPCGSLENTAEALGRSISDVASIEVNALATLRHRLADHDYPQPLSDEEPTMSRLNGFHASEPTTDTDTAEPDGKRCPNCNRSYKNPKYRRCYFRDCEASGYAAATATKAKTSRLATVDATVSSVGPAGSLTPEIEAMTLLAGLMPAARQRVLSWAMSAFGA